MTCNMKRGRFILGALSGITVVANADHVFARALADTPLPGLPAAQDRVLVLVNLQGGNDGLNCIVPFGNPNYYRLRPTIGVPQSDVLALDNQLGFNPNMKSLKGMYDKGMVAVVQGVGYPDPDHSHFRSTEIWQTAVPEKYEHTGWLGRYLDSAGLPKDNLFNGVAIAQVLPEAMIGNKVDVPAIAQLGGYGLTSDRNVDSRHTFTQLVNDNRFPFSSPYLSHVAEIEDHAQRGSEELPKLVAGYKTDASLSRDAAGAQPRAGRADRRQQHRYARALRSARLVRYARQPEGDAGPAARRILRRGRGILRRSFRSRQRRPRPHDDVQRIRTPHRRERQPRNRPRRGIAALPDRRRR